MGKKLDKKTPAPGPGPRLARKEGLSSPGTNFGDSEWTQKKRPKSLQEARGYKQRDERLPLAFNLSIVVDPIACRERPVVDVNCSARPMQVFILPVNSNLALVVQIVGCKLAAMLRRVQRTTTEENYYWDSLA